MASNLTQVVIYFPIPMLEQIDKAASKDGMNNRSQWIREACHEKMEKESRSKRRI